jgi:hypothetical protein
MKRKLLFGGFGIVCALIGGLVAHAASGTPEIDRANATMQLGGSLKHVGCVGEDNTDYITLRGSYKGGETQQTPDTTDYNLNGQVAISGIKWTINSQTLRGVFTAKIALTDPASNTSVYSGKLTLVTQGRPASGASVPARGWISANFTGNDDGVAPPNDDYLIANVEFQLSPTSAVGQFGDLNPSPGFADWSVVTNQAPTQADGTC